MKKYLFLIIFLPIIFSIKNFSFQINNLFLDNSNLKADDGNSYIESGPINWYPDSEEDSIEFGFVIHENENHDFYKKIIIDDGLNLSLYNEDYTSASDYFPCVNMPDEEELDLNPTYEYIFEIDMGDFAEKQDNPTIWQYNQLFELRSISPNILSVDNPYGNVNISLFLNEFITNCFFQTNIFNPYVAGKDGFKIIQTTADSVEFQIKVINDYDKSYDFTNSSFDVTLKNVDNDETISETATYVSQGEEENTYIYQVNNLNPNTNYEIVSLDNTDLASISPNSEIRSQIFIGNSFESGGLDTDGSFITERSNIPYIEEEGFEILDVTSNSVKFQITVVEDEGNSFDPTSSLEVTLNDSEGNPFNTMASYIKEESSGNNYVYEITELEEGTNYEIISLDNTGLASVNPYWDPNYNILINDSAKNGGLESDGTFKTTTVDDNPYIETGGFEILETTTNSVQFQITVIENEANSFDPTNDINVTMNDSSYNATYVGTGDNENSYIYEIDGLTPGTDYEIISLDNTGLAVSDSTGEIDNEITIIGDLGSEGSFKTLADNPYIEMGGFEILETTTNSVQFQITVIENEANSFDPTNDINVTMNDSSYNATYVGTGDNENSYIYEIDGLTPGTDYEIISLDSTGLAVSDSTGEIDNEITIIGDLGSEGSFKTLADNPYIETGGFEILETTTNSVQFQITVIENEANSFDPTNDINVTMNDSSYNATYVGTGDNENSYIYEIDGLTPGTDYEIISLDSTGLAVSDSTGEIDNEITIIGDLGSEGSFKTLADNPYIETGGFEILETTTNSVQFQITVIENEANSFDPTNDINVTMNDSSYNATYVGTGDNENSYIYEIDGLTPGTDYEIISLDSTGLAVSDSTGEIDNEITIIGDLGSEGSFKTLADNPYIETGGFEILETTTNSVQFQITVIENEANSFDPTNDINVTMNDSSYNATYVGTGDNENSYIYEIDGLTPGTDYEIISLDNTGLAVSDSTGEIDNEITIIGDLGSEGSFKTINDNPYIEMGGFEIINYTDTTVTYTITVDNWEKPSDTIEVSLINDEVTNQNNLNATNTYTSYLVNQEGNKYTYEIRNLNDESNYTFYSLNNTGFAIASNEADIDSQIILAEDLGIDNDKLNFVTNKTKIPNYVWMILIIVLIIIIIIAILFTIRTLHKNNEKKIKEEINNWEK